MSLIQEYGPCEKHKDFGGRFGKDTNCKDCMDDPLNETDQLSIEVGKVIMNWRCEYIPNSCDGEWRTRCGACGREGHGNCFGNGAGRIQIRCQTHHGPWFASDIEHAWQVVEAMQKRMAFLQLQSCGDGAHWRATFWKEGIRKRAEAFDESPAVAICKAALQMVANET